MGEIAVTFVSEFNNLPGVTLREKQRNLFQLFHRHIQLKESESALNLITSTLNPQNYLERVFFIDFLIYFQRFPELYQKFQDGDEITINKALKQPWFIHRAFETLQVEDFVNNILSALPYAVRLKILNKFCTHEHQCDEIFDALHKKFGLQIASILVPKCSSNKIKEIFHSHLIKLTPRQLKTVYQKNFGLIYLYCQQRERHEGNVSFMNNNPFFVHVAQTNPKMFDNLFEKYSFSISLGQRTTKKLVGELRDEILQKPESYVSILRKNSLVRKLGADFETVLIKIFPQKMTDDYQVFQFLKHAPSRSRFILYKNIFDQVFADKLSEHPELINENVLQSISDVNEREKWAKPKIEDSHFLEYVSPEYCLSLFKEKVKFLSRYQRQTYFTALLKSCVFNRDLDYLLKVFEFVSERLKNDEECISALISHFCYQKIVNDFTEQHWKHIMHFCNLYYLKTNSYSPAHNLIATYFLFLTENNKAITTKELETYYNTLDQHLNNVLYCQTFRFKSCEKLLTQLLETGRRGGDEKEFAKFDCSVISFCVKFTSQFHKRFIANDRIINSVIFIAENIASRWEYSFDFATIVEYIIQTKEPSSSVVKLQKLYFEKIEFLGNFNCIMWFARNDPSVIVDNVDTIIANYKFVNRMKLQGGFWRLIKKYSYLGLDKRIIELVIPKYKENLQLIRALAFYMPPEDFLELTKEFIPTSSTVELSSEEAKSTVEIQKGILENLKFCDSLEVILPLIFTFCKGDYLKWAITPLYSCFYRLPPSKIQPLFDKIAGEYAVSVNKHAMHLSPLVYDQSTALFFLKTSKIPALLHCLKFLSRNPSLESWKLVRENLLKIDGKSIEMLEEGVQIYVPLEYRSEYVEAVWDILKNFDKKKITDGFVASLNQSYHSISEECSAKIFQNQFPKVNDFALNYMLNTPDLKTVKDAISKSEDKQMITAFMKELFARFMRSKKCDLQFAERLESMLIPSLDLKLYFEEVLIVSLMKFKSDLENVADFVYKHYRNLVVVYGVSVFWVYAKTVGFLLDVMMKSEIDRVKFCHKLFNLVKDEDDYLLVILLLPNGKVQLKDSKMFFDEVMLGLGQVDNGAVQLHLNLYLKSRSLNF